MSPAKRPALFQIHRIAPWLLSLAACACTVLVEGRLEDGPLVHCDEHNVRLSRELDTGACQTVPGERFTVRLDDYSPQNRAVVQFSPADTPHRILAELELAVEPGGRISFAMPDLPVPAGSRIRVQIQGRYAPAAFSGHFEVGWMSLLAALDEEGLVSLWLAEATPGTAPRLFGRIPSGGSDGPDGELVFSPAGRHLVAGVPAHPGRGLPPQEAQTGGRNLRLLSVFGRRILATLEDTGGIDAVAFQEAASGSPPRLVWVRRDPQTGRLRLVAGELEEDGLGPVVTVREAPDFLLPPRLVSAFGDVYVFPRDHLVDWQLAQSATPGEGIRLITRGLTATALSCETALGQSGAERQPLDLIPVDHPELGRIVLVSCVSAEFPVGAPATYAVLARWVRWESSLPRLLDEWVPFTVTTPRLPAGWSLPPRPGPVSLALLGTFPSADSAARGPIVVDPATEDAVEVDVSALGTTGLRALLSDGETLLVYAPETWRADPPAPSDPTLLVGKRFAPGWSFGRHARDLRHALPWSEDLLVLANPHNMIQSTLDDFTAGLPGALFTPSACVHAVLKPSYR
jgi:hypothetical protein